MPILHMSYLLYISQYIMQILHFLHFCLDAKLHFVVSVLTLYSTF